MKRRPDGTLVCFRCKGSPYDRPGCWNCGGAGWVTGESIPWPERPWDEVAPNLWVGGHHSQDEPHVLVGDDFDLVVSLHRYNEPGYTRTYGPARGVPHLYYEIEDTDLNPLHHTAIDGLAEQVAVSVMTGSRVLVRCQGGFNRSAMVAALAMIRLGHPPGEAIDMIRAARNHYCLFNRSFEQYVLGHG